MREDRSAKPLEAVLAYQRPMLEDGTIEFELYYVPGEFEVHPAVGRVALLLQPTGVKQHKLTNARWETADLRPDNEAAVEGAADAVPLKANDWNRVAVSVQKDLLTLTVNGTEVAKYTLTEPAAERFFGLFRYADQTKCRVRKLTYRGDWPKELPDAEQQVLAYPKGGFLAEVADQATETVEIALSGTREQLEQRGVSVKNEAAVSFSDAGAAIAVDKPAGVDQPTGLLVKRPIDGDCDVVLDFDRLQLASTPQAAHRGLGLRMAFDAKNSAADLYAEMAVVTAPEGKQSLQANLSHRRLDDAPQTDSRQFVGEWKAGRFRIVRREGLVHCLFADKNSDEFRLLATYPVGYAPISEIQVLGYSDGDAPADDAKPLVHAVAEKLVVRTLRSAAAAAQSTAEIKKKR